MTSIYFRDDNTEGYSPADLRALNAAWDSLPISVADDWDIVVKSTQDHIAARLLMAYDRGLRGDDLTRFYYAPEGAVAWKFADPTEGARWIYDEAEARDIAREDPSLLAQVVEDVVAHRSALRMPGPDRQFGRVHQTLDQLRADMLNLKTRLTALELDVAHIRVGMAELNARMDRIEVRIERIERRLDLVEGTP